MIPITKRFLYLIILMSYLLKAQVNENTKLPHLNPPSPKSYEFLKYGEIPVKKYTGVPEISVPIYTIEAKGLSIPVAMMYNSGGFKVSEEAGWTGLGWSLTGGGAIIQVVNGYDDFGPLLRNRFIPDLAEIFDIQGAALPGQTIMDNCEVTLIESNGKYNNQPYYSAGWDGYYYIPVELFEGTKDFEPDIFKFSMPGGYSGEFLLDWKNEIFVCLTDSKIKIAANDYVNESSGTPSAFSITVPEGHKFTFTLKEITTINQSLGLRELFPNGNNTGIDMAGKVSSRSYQLTTIITNQGDRIDYDYLVTNPIKNLPSISRSVIRYRTVGTHNPFPNDMSDNFTTFYYTQQQYSYLNKISFNNGILLFTVSDRTDLIGAKKLDKIQLKTNDASSIVTKELNFGYDYFVGHTNGTNEDQYLNYGTGSPKTSTELTNRLKLNNVQFTGEPSYNFEYNSEPLPKKTSLAADYWGFYNGVLTNQNSFPNLYALNQERGNPLFIQYEANNKGSSLQHTKAGVLQKITYPTKGYTTFDYELNSYINNNKISPFIAYDQLPASVNSRQMNGLPINRSVLVENNGTVFSGGAYLSTRGCTGDQATNNNNTYIKIQVFKESLISYVEQQPNYSSYGLQYVLGTLGFINGTHPLYSTYIDQVIYIQKSANEEEKNLSNLSYTFNRGIVVFTASGGCGTYNGTTNSSHAHLSLFYRGYFPAEPYANGAGLRIKTINNFDADGSLASSKRYDYFGGRLMDALLYYSNTLILNYDWIDYAVGSHGVSRHSSGEKKTFSSNNFISPSGRNTIGYDRVDELLLSNQDSSLTNGKISEYYRNDPNAGILPSMSMSAIPKVDNGLLYKKEIYDKAGVLQKIITNTYSTDKIKCYYGLKQNLKAVEDEVIANTSYSWYKYDVGLKPSVATNISNLKSTETTYFSDLAVKVEKEFQYNSLNQLIYIKETNSDGDVIETFNSYPIDVQMINPSAYQMVASNVFDPIVNKHIKVNGTVVSNYQYEYYKRLGNNNNFVLPDVYSLSKAQSAKGTSSLTDDLIFSQYDNLGNPLEIRTSGGEKITYIWGYNKQFPIAVIKNASYIDLAPYIGNILSLSNADSDRTVGGAGQEGALRVALNNLRGQTAFVNSQITTYTYDPLIGVTSITGPDGLTIYYDYDAQGRLLYTKDNQGNVLQANTYHYKN